MKNISSKNLLNENYFKPLLNEFIKENKQLYLESGYPYGLFIPYTFPNYEKAQLKIFYVGRDTYWWTERDKMLKSYENGVLENYLAENTLPVDVDKSLKNWGNNAGSFWSFVNKLHLYIRTKEIKNLNHIEDCDKEVLKEIGYGNINCMELNQTLIKNEGRPAEDFDMGKLDLLRKKTKVFDNVSHIIKAYKPDFVVILNWDNGADYYLDGFNYIWQESLFEESIQAVYLSNEVKTKIVWSSHPNRFKFLGENQENMARKLGNLILSLNNSAE